MIKKISLSVSILAYILFACSSYVYAQSYIPTYNMTVLSADTITPYAADTITTIYRTYNGKLQYRRWNQSKNVWVDPYWIDC